MRMQEYYVELYNCYCCIVSATTPSAAMKESNRQFSEYEKDYGGCQAKSARLATDKDRAWVRGMSTPISVKA